MSSCKSSRMGGDAILARLDCEHAVAFQAASTLTEADVEGESKELKNACLAFDAVGYAAASFPATSIEGLKSKTRILARQGRGLTAGEIIWEAGT